MPQIHLLELFKAAYIRFSRNSLAVPKSFKSLTIQFMQFYFRGEGRGGERKCMQLLTVWLKFCSKHNGVKDPMKRLDSSVGILTIETVEVGSSQVCCLKVQNKSKKSPIFWLMGSLKCSCTSPPPFTCNACCCDLCVFC